MDVHTLLLIGLIILITHFVGGVAAYASTLLALPLVAWITGDVRTSVLALLVIATLQSGYILAHMWRSVAWRELWRVVVIAGIGLPIGVLTMDRLPETPLLIGLGAVAIASGVARFFIDPEVHLIAKSRPFLNSLLLVGGIVHGAFACGGTTLAIYSQYVFPQKDGFRATLSGVWVALGVMLIAGSFAHGMWNGHVETLILIGAPAGILASWLGQRTAQRVEPHVFARLVCGLLVGSRIMTILRAGGV